MIPPSVGGFDSPLIHVPINAEWIDLLLGFCVDTLLKDSTWEGTESEIADAIDKVDSLVLALMSGYSRVGMIEWHILDALPAGMHVLDGTQLNRVDYPTFYDAVDPAFHLDADTIILPDLRDKFIKVEHAGEAIGAGGGNKTTTLTAANHAAHTHGANTGNPGTHFFLGQSVGGDQNPQTTVDVSASGTETRISAFGATAAQGSATPFSNEPQYRVLGAAIWLW